MKVNGKNYRTIWFDRKTSKINIIDQTKLPHEFLIKTIDSFRDSVNAIKNMEVRGAPLIGAMSAYGITLALKDNPSDSSLDVAIEELINSRPTAINIKWATCVMKECLEKIPEAERYEVSLSKADEICNDDISYCKKIGQYGKDIILNYLRNNKKSEVNILTHCNAGWLATIDWGTATSPIYQAFQDGIKIHVWVDETRPRNQGSAITSFELNQEGIPNTIVADNTGGLLMQKGMVDLCITGADRITPNGDAVNKIGTYLKALAAHDNNIPFYVAIPSSTIDWDAHKLQDVPIEERSPSELSYMEGIDENNKLTKIRIYPKESKSLNLAFDITPSKYITSLITEKGICEASNDGLKKLFPDEKLS
ncbi:MAG: S-methyl-5-thioribose-1-phosphate isomerase [Pseudomonadota bacterium]|nr:S-methyl-5-thioribose-1-phosphate isomerase [Pseudomonadota bacterium]